MDHPENLNSDLSDDDRWQIAELSVLIEGLDRHQNALERLEHDDPLGFCAFADRPGWVEARLHGKVDDPPK